MATLETRNTAMTDAIHRPVRGFSMPKDEMGKNKKLSEYYAEHTFDIATAKDIPDEVRKELLEVISTGKKLEKKYAEMVANVITEWAIGKGATHFTHWFQPLTGATAEKHDSFLSLEDGQPIDKLGAGQLLQGEPDASSFPHGGSRSTFEARGYTSWDLSSPMFLVGGNAGKTLCIPTAFVSYKGDALDVKTPLLRSIARLNKTATKFANLAGLSDVRKTSVSCGAEQEYFLIDKSFYFARPDLVMTGRTLFGNLTAKNQQLDDHYFGAIPSRTLSFMEELDYELHRLGVPAKTRHNEVAPGQFEIAPIFSDANIAADNNLLLMATIKRVAEKHNYMALLHEKPFAGINGSGKHVNWSVCTDSGRNLLEPGHEPHSNKIFLACTAIVIEAVQRHAKMLRMAISGHGNDHRLGANEAPPSIISVYLGDMLNKVFGAIKDGKEFSPETMKKIDTGVTEIAELLKDNTDRNRTSPFAFTGNKFEFRAVGSSASIGFPVSILNAAVAEVFCESNTFMEAELAKGTNLDKALIMLAKKWITSSWNVVFNGDGYSDEWVKEAERRGLPNLRTTPDALPVLMDKKEISFLTEPGVYTHSELETRYNVLIERYILCREIEFQNLKNLVVQNIIPCALDYKRSLGDVILAQRELGLESTVETDLYKYVNTIVENIYSSLKELNAAVKSLPIEEQEKASKIADTLMPLSEKLAAACNTLEINIPNESWNLATYYDMLYLR